MHVKVESRLLSSKILAAEAQEAVKGLKAVLTPGIASKAHSKARPPVAASRDEGEEEAIEKQAVDPIVGLKLTDDNSSEGDIAELDEANDMVDDDDWESGSVDDIEHAGNDNDDIESSPSRKQTKQPSSLSLSGSHDLSSSAAASVFLPSLSVGYIRGDSDSDVDPSDGETAAPGRKNRRGQRARQL